MISVDRTASIQRNLFGWVNCFVRMQRRILFINFLIINKVNQTNKEHRTQEYTRMVERDTNMSGGDRLRTPIEHWCCVPAIHIIRKPDLILRSFINATQIHRMILARIIVAIVWWSPMMRWYTFVSCEKKSNNKTRMKQHVAATTLPCVACDRNSRPTYTTKAPQYLHKIYAIRKCHRKRGTSEWYSLVGPVMEFSCICAIALPYKVANGGAELNADQLACLYAILALIFIFIFFFHFFSLWLSTDIYDVSYALM